MYTGVNDACNAATIPLPYACPAIAARLPAAARDAQNTFVASMYLAKCYNRAALLFET